MDTREIRVRFPPSPTGFLHIGNIRTFVFNWLFAKQNKGKIVLRLEDTDKARSEKKFEDAIIQDLKWLGLDYDEFARQSERLEIHKKYLKQLLDTNKAYEDEGAIKLRVDEHKKIVFQDLVKGEIEFDTKHEKDFVIARTMESPLYHLAVVVDDYEMRISHIIRGEDHVANTAKHILLQEALGFDRPQYAHLPLILGADRSKLGKRHGAVALDEYKKDYIPDAIFNYLAVLGFSPPDGNEILSRDELIKAFDFSKIHTSGAIFDIKKLEWINGEYIKKMSDRELTDAIGEQYVKILPMVRERMKKLSDLEEFNLFFEAPTVDPDLLTWKKSTLAESKAMLANVKAIIEKEGIEDLRNKLDELGKATGDRGLVYWPLRVALSGRKASPDPIDIATILGKEEVLKRINAALD